ncbi:MAG: ABC transporter ATP-binding protein [Geminicoccaceae bacterium]
MIGVYTRMLDLLPPRRRGVFALLIAMMIATALIDLAGVAAILPFLAVVSDPTAIERSELLSRLHTLTGASSDRVFLQILGGFVFAVVITSILVRGVTFYAITLFNRKTLQYLAVTLLERYLARPYEWFLTRNSAEVGKNILAEAHHVVMFAIAPAIRLLANGCAAAAMILFLIYLEPVGATVTALALALAGTLIYWRVDRWRAWVGDDRLRASEERFRVTREAMGGIKEIKLRGLEATFTGLFRGPSDRLAKRQATVQLIGDIPHYAMEALCFGGMLIFVLWLLHSSGSINAFLPVLGAFAFAGLKLLPLVKMLFKDAASLRSNLSAVDSLHRDIKSLPPLEPRPPTASLPLKERLELRDISYRYPGSDRNVLNDLSLTIRARSCVGFVGGTGAGKTTLIDVILGLIEPRTGHLLVDGVVITDANRRSWQESIGYVPQTVHLADDTITANIAFGIPQEAIDPAQVERAARLACLHDFVTDLEAGYDTVVGEGGVRLSGGQRQRIGIARALFRDPDLIFFDEATNALDTVTERAVMDAVQSLRGEKTLIMVTHRLTTVRHCDAIFVMEAGRIVSEGSYQALSSESTRFKELLAAM